MSLRIRITSRAQEPLDEQRLVRLLIRQARQMRASRSANATVQRSQSLPAASEDVQ